MLAMGAITLHIQPSIPICYHFSLHNPFGAEMAELVILPPTDLYKIHNMQS